MLLLFGVEKFGTVFHGPGDLGLSPNTSVFGVLALPVDADGAIDGASMPRVLESPRSWLTGNTRADGEFAVPGRICFSEAEKTSASTGFFHILS